MSTTEPPPPNDPPTPSSLRAEGSKLAGCYLLSRRLTIGQEKEVWLAFDQVLGKEVSLHFIPEAVRKDSRAVQELRLDVKRNRQLIHPNILRVYDLVEEPEWVAISMDPFDAESLSQRLERQVGKGANSGEIQPWVEQLAQTLEEAHKISVLHLDLTPSNLFLAPDGKLLVADFGISRTIREAQGRVGAKETPDVAYRSPQSLDAKAPAVTDDVYSFGAVLYAALTGHPPSRKGGPAGALASLGTESLGVPENWRSTIAACLDKEPAARPQSAADVSRRLKAGTSETAALPSVSPKKEAAPPTPPATSEPAESKLGPAATSLAVTNPVAPAAPAAKAPPKEPRKEPEISKSVAPVTPAKAPQLAPSRDFAPRLYPTESRFPFTGLAAVAAVLVIGAIVYHLVTSEKPDAASDSPAPQPEKVEVQGIATAPPPPISSTPSEGAPVVDKKPTKEPPASVGAEPSVKAVAEQMAVLDKAKQAAQAAEKIYAELLQQQQLTESGVAEIQKNIDEKAKAAEQLKKTAQEAVAQRNKMDEEQKAAEVAALDAQKSANEKARLAEEAKKAFVDFEKTNLEKMTATQQAEVEIAALQKTLAEKQRLANDGAKALAQAETAKQRDLAAIADTEREIARLKSADSEAQRQREAAEAQRSKLDQELADMQRAFKERMAELENKRKSLENPGMVTSPDQPAPPPSTATPPPVAPSNVTLPPAVPPATAAPATPPAATQPEAVKLASIPATPAPVLTTPQDAAASAGANTLGLKFARVGDVEFSIWQTRVKDFEVFAKAVNLKSISWKGPGFKQGPDHPVVNVTWHEAIAFCKWLTDKEHKDGTLPAQQFYRLPTDLEWSKAVGLTEESGKTPEVRDMGVPDEYPWGKAWPPPSGAGNYTGEETGSDVAIKGYDDGFAWTAPVGSFEPNKFGLYDMGGNVWQWCMDTWNAESKAKVLRGASWYNGALKLSLLSSCRVHAAPDSSTDNYGFRIVRATDAGKPGKK